MFQRCTWSLRLAPRVLMEEHVFSTVKMLRKMLEVSLGKSSCYNSSSLLNTTREEGENQ